MDTSPLEIILDFTPVHIEHHDASTHDYPDGSTRHTPAFTAYGMTDGHGSFWTIEVPDFPAAGTTVDVAKASGPVT